MRGGMYTRDRRDVALYRRRLLAGLHLESDKRAHGVGIRRQVSLAYRFAIRLEYRPIGLLGPQRIGRVSALRHRLPFEQSRQRTFKHQFRWDRRRREFGAPLGHFPFIHRFSKEIKNATVMITVIIPRPFWGPSDHSRDRLAAGFRIRVMSQSVNSTRL
jgi:hypothetical protein